MSGRRNGNQIRGPKSALTDFLAVSSDGENTTEESGTVSDPDQANNISAQQIRDDYERRRAQAVADAAAASGSNSNDQDDVEEQDEEEAEAAIERSRKRRRVQQEAIASIKSKKGKDKKARGKKRKFKKDSDDDDSNDSDYDIDDLERDMNKKKTIKLPGQLENCDVCGKRFTVTPYSKAGPDGGLLCTPCGKQLAAELGESSRAKTKTGSQGRKRRKFESEKLDGRAPMGVKSLSQLCIEKVVQHHGDIDDLGDLPQPLMERLSAIFTKNRVMKPKTLPLFLRPDHDAVIIHDCAYLGHDNFVEMIAKTPLLGKLVLGNACQFKEETMKYLTEKADKLKYLHLYAANLVTNEAFSSFFETRGQYLETLKLKWLDSSFEDSNVADIVSYCPNLVRLKLERCRKLTEESLQFIMQMGCSLQHLSLQFSNPVSNVELMALLEEVGSNLKTLSLRGFVDIDDDVLDTIHNCCNSLSKLRITDNDTCTDEGFAQLFENWYVYLTYPLPNPPYFAKTADDETTHRCPRGTSWQGVA